MAFSQNFKILTNSSHRAVLARVLYERWLKFIEGGVSDDSEPNSLACTFRNCSS